MKDQEHLPKCLQKHAAFIDSVSDERSLGEGYWVILRDGWCPTSDPQNHTIHEDTPEECAAYFPVEPCFCRDCRVGDDAGHHAGGSHEDAI